MTLSRIIPRSDDLEVLTSEMADIFSSALLCCSNKAKNVPSNCCLICVLDCSLKAASVFSWAEAVRFSSFLVSSSSLLCKAIVSSKAISPRKLSKGFNVPPMKSPKVPQSELLLLNFPLKFIR